MQGSYSAAHLNNDFSSSTNYADIYSNDSIQNQQNYYTGNSLSTDQLCWENRVNSESVKVMKISEKMEMVELSSNLSPVNFFSNVELESCKNPGKGLNYFTRYDNQWYNQNNCIQRSYDLPSCAQMSKHTEKSPKYCSTQKSLDFLMKNCSYNIDNTIPENFDYPNKNGYKSSSDFAIDYNSYEYYDNNLYYQPIPHSDLSTSSNIPFTPIIKPIDQQTEDSNDDSDIIVEETDEEVTDFSEDQDKRQYYQRNRCLVCNVNNTPLGTQFYYLTAESPLTMSSQRPVVDKIIEIVGALSTTRNYLCSECLGLINTVDHLQFKLEGFRSELNTKFEKTCIDNDIRDKKGIREKSVKPIKKSWKFLKFRCRTCKKIFCLKSYFQYHIKRHKSNRFLCDFCGIVSNTKRKFALHLKLHNKSIKIDSFKCSNCEKTHRTKSNLKEHENYCLGTLPFSCKYHYCTKKFASANKLKNHVKLKHEKKFIAICSICNIGFVKVSDYKSHMITHSTDKKHSCSICSKSYKTLSNLNFHMKVHNRSMPFSCLICKKGFMRKEYLEAHVNNHNGVKNYTCTVCDKKFASQKNLDAHLKYHEGTIKKSTCNICGKTMGSGFEDHLRAHSNLKEFDCENCDTRFNTKGALNKHVKRKHSCRL